ncbi:MAG: hypothetical protein HQK60_19355 [Deltaproteobacteria bacterium]|nr:hypothetical protein [Deltaproteobacteria bacterium]
MDTFYLGLELLKFWSIQNFELFDFMRKGLWAYDQRGRLVVNYESFPQLRSYISESKEDYNLVNFNISKEQKEAKAQLEAILFFTFRIEDVRLFAEANGLPLPPQPPTPEPPPPPKVKIETTVDRKFRNRLACRRVAKQLWEDDPTVTIASMVRRPEIIEACEGSLYPTKDTVRNWIQNLCPNRKPGRRKK